MVGSFGGSGVGTFTGSGVGSFGGSGAGTLAASDADLLGGGSGVPSLASDKIFSIVIHFLSL